jgi:hypothetical protein
MSVVSLGLGLATIFVFRRGLPHAGLIVGYIVLLWLIVAGLAETRLALVNTGRGLVVSAADYAVQTLYHNLLLFVLPAYYASATLTSGNVLFVAGVAAAALLTAVDPWYGLIVRERAWLNHTLLGFSIFAALNVALPLVGVRPIVALVGSAILAALALTPAFKRRVGGWRRAHALAVALAALAVVAVWYARALVPPAPLFLTRAVAARDVVNMEPVDEVRGALPAATLVTWGGLAAFTAVRAPAGLRQAIEHVWWRDGAIVRRMPLATPITGGREQGFRTFSRRTDLTPPLAGRYTVDVMTASGQLIGRLRFTVSP